MKLVFFGDSLTDMYRNYDPSIDIATSYGVGYVFDIAGELMLERPGYYQILNRGVSGNKITDLFNRYERDVIEAKPDVLTILIGVNDVWHKLVTHNGTPIDIFEEIYFKMVNDIKKKLPNTRIIMMEPFFLHGDATKNNWEEFQEVLKYSEICKKVADQTGAIFIPLQNDFKTAAKDGDSTQLLYDGVHTNPGGAHLIATKWLKVFRSFQ